MIVPFEMLISRYSSLLKVISVASADLISRRFYEG